MNNMMLGGVLAVNRDYAIKMHRKMWSWISEQIQLLQKSWGMM